MEDLLFDIADKLKNLGRRLCVSESRLEEIDEAHAELSEKGYYMLKHWKNKGFNATYQALHDALLHPLVNRPDVAERFCFVFRREGMEERSSFFGPASESSGVKLMQSYGIFTFYDF